MSQYLSSLIPTSCAAWYNLADVTSAANVTTVKDVSGNGRDLSGPASNKPTYVLNGIGTKPVIRFASTSKPLTYSPTGTLTIKDMVLLAKYTQDTPSTPAVFDNWAGLVSDDSNTINAALVGETATGKFYDYDPPAPAENEYRKDWTFYAEDAMAAPINTFGVIQYSMTGGYAFTSTAKLQIGRHIDLTARVWKGDIAEMLFFTSVLTEGERRRIKLYFDLKYDRYLTDSTKLEFPDPTMTGIGWSRFYAEPLPWDQVKVEHKYEDEGVSLSHTTDTPPKLWQISFTGLSPEEAEIFDAFNDTAKRTKTFDFTDKYGTKHSGVRITSYERNHDGHKSWVNSVEFTLAKYY